MKKHVIENWRVEVEPDSWLSKKDEDVENLCKSIAADIRRHVDSYKSISVRCDEWDACSFCRSVWEVEPSGMPVCCSKAIAEWLGGRTHCDACDSSGLQNGKQCSCCHGAGAI